MNQDWLKQLPIEQINKVTPASGGDVNDAYAIEAEEQKYFLLVQPNTSKEFFIAEAEGLKYLQEAGITVPEVYHFDDINGDAYLLISYLEEGGAKDYRALAKTIARMHQTHSPNEKFGYPHPHQGGDMIFDNAWTNSWIELFVDRRLDVLRDELVHNGKWNSERENTYEQVREVIVDELENHPNQPSLLHGDLWGGNHMFLTDGEPALFDPAPFYGDREFDLGVTTSFGAFPKIFYETYQHVFPMADDFEKRLAFYKLYVFMVHFHKFGGIYKTRVDQTMQEILFY